MATVQTPPLPFKAGDQVVFKSSSKLLMTVLELKSDTIQTMYYNTVTGKFEKAFFPLFAIKKYAAPTTT